ncbi:DoxX family protein [Microbacterium sp.]|uniref:DoxX family protein n=1 Tax=Microbacterium sp. TaxID=51671 RepID=UPI0025D52895|nr:DoxX family protein [Microbacterium sp.]
MLIALWIINGLLALAFLAAGSMKLFRPKAALQSMGMAWTEDFPDAAVKLVGAAEIVGAVGLILPLLTGIAPLLTPIAATALALLMLGAVVVHLRRKETPVPPLVLGILSAVSAVIGFLVVLG